MTLLICHAILAYRLSYCSMQFYCKLSLLTRIISFNTSNEHSWKYPAALGFNGFSLDMTKHEQVTYHNCLKRYMNYIVVIFKEICHFKY